VIQLKGTFSKLLVLIGFCLFFGGIFALGGAALAKPIFGISIEEASDLLTNIDSESISVLKFLQLFNTLGLFIFPGILFALLFIPKPVHALKLDRSLTMENVLWITLLFVPLLPITNWLIELNSSMQFPESMQAIEEWIKASENRAAELTKVFLQMDGCNDLIYNLFLIAVLPAIGEELIFRGIIQRTINENRKNYHWGVWISAILFSALHMQFYGFIPRVFLGAFFGYLFVWTRTLWAPIFAHLLNNGSAVLLTYFYGSETIEKEFDQLGTTDETYGYGISAVFIFGILLYFFLKRQKSLKQIDQSFQE
jgi:membrane protease YdiL (CAAX protease family)